MNVYREWVILFVGVALILLYAFSLTKVYKTHQLFTFESGIFIYGILHVPT